MFMNYSQREANGGRRLRNSHNYAEGVSQLPTWQDENVTAVSCFNLFALTVL